MRSRRGSSPHPILSYLLAVALSAAVFGIRNTMVPHGAERLVFIPFMPVIIVVAAVGGLGPGLLATLIATALAVRTFGQVPGVHLWMDMGRLPGLAVFVLSGVAVSWVCESLRAARRRLEREGERLRESDVFHGAIAELTYDFAFKARLEPDGRLVLASVSEGFERLLGVRLEDLPGPDRWMTLIHPDDRAGFFTDLQRLTHGETVEGDFRVLPRDGRELWVRYRTRPVRRPDGVLELFGAVENIDERRRAILEAQRLAGNLQIVTDSMGAAVAHCSRDMRYVWVSRAYLAWRGTDEDRVVGHPVREVLGEAAWNTLLPYFERVLAGETVEYEELVDVRGLGPRWIHAIYTPARGARGAVEGWVAVVMDVTARRETEAQLREADRRKDEFLAILAHELRNPLAPVLSALEVLRHEQADSALRGQATAMMARQVQQMVRLIDDLLDVARLTRGTLELRRERLDLRDVVHDAIETTRPLIERPGHLLTVELPPDPVRVEGDRVRLAQVFSNLLNNAARYSDEHGHITLTLARAGREARVTVQDRGVGIPPSALPHVFEMFSRVDTTMARSRGGLGVGLGLVRRLVELHGGAVSAHSEGPGHGSTFAVSLPLAPAGVARAAGVPDTARRDASGAARRVLVVDDNEDAAVSLAHLLRLSGHEARTVHDPFETLAVAESERPDLILLDIGLPGLDGYQLARRIRSEPWGRDVALVAVTGWGREEDRLRSSEVGFDGHLVKPVDLDTLRNLVASLPARPVRGNGAPGR